MLFIDFINRGAPLAQVKYKTIPVLEGQATYTLDQEDIDILDAVITIENNTDIALGRVSQGNYNHLPRKDQVMRPTQFTTNRGRDTLTMTLWGVPDQDYSIKYYSIARIGDVLNSQQNVDFNFRYLPAIISGLTYYLSFNIIEFGLDKRQELKGQFEDDLDRARVEDMERVAHFVLPFAY